MENAIIDYEALTDIIADELYEAQAADEGLAGYKVIVSQERANVGEEDKANAKSIFVAVSFGGATIDYGQSIIPVTLSVYGEQRTFRAARTLLNRFAAENNLKRDGRFKQLWVTPDVEDPISPVGNGYRSLFSLSGVIQYFGAGGNPVVEIAYRSEPSGKPTQIFFLQYSPSWSNALRPQPKSDSKGRAESASAYSTFSFGVTAYVASDAFFQRLLGMVYGHEDGDGTYYMTITHLDGTSYSHAFRVAQFSGSQQVATLLTATVTFAE